MTGRIQQISSRIGSGSTGTIPGGTAKNLYGQITSIPTGVATGVVSYTVPAGHTATLLHATTSGTNRAQWVLYKNGIAIATRYAGVTALDGDFLFALNQDTQGLALSAGDVLRIEVTNGASSLGDFTGRIYVIES